MDAISGMKTELIPIPELAKMGVGRVSIPVASCMVAHKALMDFFTALRAAPQGILPGETKWVAGFEEFTDFVGLKEYQASSKTSIFPRREWKRNTGAAEDRRSVESQGAGHVTDERLDGCASRGCLVQVPPRRTEPSGRSRRE